MKNNALKIALAVLTLAGISPIHARDAPNGNNEHSSSEPKSASSHPRSAASDRISHKNRNSADRVRAQKARKNAGAKSKRKPPAATPEIIEEKKVELPSRDDIDNLDDNGPALMPDTSPHSD